MSCSFNFLSALVSSRRSLDIVRAIETNNIDKFIELIANEPNVNIGYGPNPVLWYAVLRERPEMVRILIAREVDVDIPNGVGETPLMRAVIWGNIEIAKMLVEAGANINTVDPKKGRPAVSWAIRGRYPEIAAYLLSHGAQTDLIGMQGETPVKWAEWHGMTDLLSGQTAITD